MFSFSLLPRLRRGEIPEGPVSGSAEADSGRLALEMFCDEFDLLWFQICLVVSINHLCK